ncbi:hypothetical protein [Clostridium sp. UBA6640]|uniref:hypothetical protein n=1 Tax=Clostridium sp. UBA6640 TaxID=1946370 RepID=UPI0025C408E7|nr:hypothetical protein [Clostridium sp. UBA6640]
MKSCNKKVIIAILIIFVISILTFVFFKKDVLKVAYGEDISPTKDKVLYKFFKLQEDTTLYYSGSLEYAEEINVSSTESNDSETIVNISGKVIPMSNEGLDESKLNIKLSYILDGNSVRQIIDVPNDVHSQSIIKDSKILISPLVVDNTWTENFNYRSKEYTASTKIITIGKNEEGKRIIQTETTVNNIEGFGNNTYKETKTYTEGLGLTNFTRTLPSFGDSQTPCLDFTKKLFKAN